MPFGEYIPWRNVFGDSFGKLDMIPRDMVSGTREEPLRVGGALVADAICFDVAYDDGLYDQVDHGAQLVVVQTSNAMFIHTAQIEQQFEISRAAGHRARPVVVVASVNGRTGIIGPDGAVVASADPRTTAVARRRGHARLLDHARHAGRALGRPAGRPVDAFWPSRWRCSAIVGAATRASRPRRSSPPTAPTATSQPPPADRQDRRMSPPMS